MRISFNLRNISWNTVGTIFSIIFSGLTLIFLIKNSNIANSSIREMHDQTILAEKTIEEMKAQRIQSQKPVLYLSSEHFSIYEKPDSYTFGLGNIDPIDFDWVNETEVGIIINQSIIFLQNTGIGPAYEIEIQWDFDIDEMIKNLKTYSEFLGDDIESKNTLFFIDALETSLKILGTQNHNYRYPIAKVEDGFYIEIPWLFFAYCNYITFIDSNDLSYSHIDETSKFILGKRTEYLEYYGHKLISFNSNPVNLMIKYKGINGESYSMKKQLRFMGFVRLSPQDYLIENLKDANDCFIEIISIDEKEQQKS